MEFLSFLESVRTPFLDSFLSLITKLGEETFMFVLLLPVMWCSNKKTGYFIIYAGFIGLFFNQLLKGIFKVPRPWVKNPMLNVVESAREGALGYSFPSGHTSNSTIVFGGLGLKFKNNILKICFLLLILIIAFSRLYLGVHTPLDVGVSLVVGAIVLLCMNFLFKVCEKSLKIDIIVNCLFILFSIMLVVFYEVTKVNNEFSQDGLKQSYVLLGAISAALISRIIDVKKLHFDTKAKWWVQIIKCVFGFAILFAIKTLLKEPLLVLFNMHNIADTIRYFVMVMFIGTLWPMTFKYFKKI